MRALTIALTMASALLATSAALAAPTCRNLDGVGMRCGTPGAMPVGWSPSPQQRAAWRRAAPADLTGNELAALIALVGGLFAMIALMPKFDGSQDADWDRQDRKSTRLNSSHLKLSRMPSSA